MLCMIQQRILSVLYSNVDRNCSVVILMTLGDFRMCFNFKKCFANHFLLSLRINYRYILGLIVCDAFCDRNMSKLTTCQKIDFKLKAKKIIENHQCERRKTKQL